VIGISILTLEGVDYSEILVSYWVAYIKTRKNIYIYIYISGLEGSQAVPARPSGRGSAFNRKLDFIYIFNITPEGLHYCEN
jgi:hypothetical protein